MKRKADRQNAREEHEKALRTSGEEEAVEFVPRSLHCATIKGAVADRVVGSGKDTRLRSFVTNAAPRDDRFDFC